MSTQSTDTMSGTWSVTHPLTPADKDPAAAIRATVQPMKGKLRGTASRAAFANIFAQIPQAKGVTYDRDTIGGVPGCWCRPAGAKSQQAILYLHGGSYVLGSADAFRHLVGHLASRTGTPAFAADYRLGPEHPFPAAVEDAQAAYRGLAGRGVRRIVIAGDSAGGGLGLVLLSSATAEANRTKRDMPLGMVAFSPWTDLTLMGASMEDRAATDPIFVRDQLAEFARLYLGDHDASNPQASPLYGNLTGLPPIRVHVGDDEVLLDDSRRYVAKAVAAGVDACVEIWQQMMHVFPANIGRLAAADAALNAAGAFIAERLSSDV